MQMHVKNNFFYAVCYVHSQVGNTADKNTNMATHVHDNSIIERRLRPIYGNYCINSLLKLNGNLLSAN